MSGITTRIRGRCLDGGMADLVVRKNGAALTGRLDDEAALLSMTVDDTPVTDAGMHPRAGFNIVITGIIITTGKDVGVNGANVDIYYADSVTSTDTANAILQVVELASQLAVNATPMQIVVPPGNYVLGKTNDNSCAASVQFHYEVA